MQYIKLPEADWQSICDATREKTGGTEKLLSGEVAAAIGGIEEGEQVYTADSGAIYRREMVLNAEGCDNAAPTFTKSQFKYATEMVTFESNYEGQLTSDYLFWGCTALKTVTLPKCTGIRSTGNTIFGGNQHLERVTMGSIGNPVTIMAAGPFTVATVTLELYVSYTTIANANAQVGANIPSIWGENTTIIYRNATTGEVLTA